MLGGNVHRQWQLQPFTLQLGNALQGVPEYPLAQPNLQLRARQGREKVARPQQALFRVLPAQQAFGPDHGTVLHIHLGLQVQGKFTPLQRLPQAFALLVLFVLAACQGCVKAMKAVAPGLFGLVHGLVGMAQEGISVGIVFREQRVADAGCDVYPLVFQRIGRGNVLHELAQLCFAVGAAVQAGQQDDELIAPQAG